jgi:hypothetical protein
MDLAIDAQFAHTARDQLRVLGTEVEDQNAIAVDTVHLVGVVYSMYDALVSINVPTDKAKAVIDAMEREMMDKVATKADLEHARDVLSNDIRATKADVEHVRDTLTHEIRSLELSTRTEFATVRSEMSSEFKLVRQEMAAMGASLGKDLQIQMAGLENRLTVRLGTMTAGMISVATAITGAIAYFH